ncbi:MULTISPECIES: hypothetical protein [unclassified Treponema]|uniref:hypothetical protein n=1 Tax=unclassified Treponema TaxID=2638727 RepID=UPI00053010F1|nr:MULTISPECIES: hypothetical protein [unclassified Treponema]AIW90252.1 hypothetical protein JO41_10935 [Treponema sp. OMZ 838]UTC43678.1 hypothetical protein E4N66_06125 [Treponema sp. OMZ 857]UTC49710.1 hypothetical protein E4N65_06160 [Treponema sp. OMZ 855]
MEFLIFGLPIVALIWLISAIIQFCRTNKENIEKRKALKKEIIICSIIIVAWIVIIGGFIFLLMRSIAINGM